MIRGIDQDRNALAPLTWDRSLQDKAHLVGVRFPDTGRWSDKVLADNFLVVSICDQIARAAQRSRRRPARCNARRLLEGSGIGIVHPDALQAVLSVLSGTPEAVAYIHRQAETGLVWIGERLFVVRSSLPPAACVEVNPGDVRYWHDPRVECGRDLPKREIAFQCRVAVQVTGRLSLGTLRNARRAS